MNYKTDRLRPTLNRFEFDALMAALKKLNCEEFAELYVRLKKYRFGYDKRKQAKCRDTKP
ncbi:MAG: hypothetical protein WC261_07375 [Synergistaceae bacterium]